MARDSEEAQARKGRQAAMVIAGSAVFWMLAELAGAQWGWSTRTRALMTLIAGAGFVWALWMIYTLWRARRNNQG